MISVLRKLEQLTIGNQVTQINEYEFYKCEKLTTVTIPGSVTSIGNSAFAYSGLTSVTIPNSVTSIGYETFSSCTGLTSVTMPASVTSIGGSAFYNCTGLTPVTIPNSVTEIGSYAFYSCTGLTSVTLNNCSASIGYRAFNNCYNLTSLDLGNAVTEIGGGAFDGCGNLTAVTIPGTVTAIGDYAFTRGYDNLCPLKTLIIADSSTPLNLGRNFSNSEITDFYLGRNVTTGYGVVGPLKTLTISNNVTLIEDGTFRRSNVSEIISRAVTPPTLTYSYHNDFFNVLMSCKVIVPAGSENAYRAENGWSRFFLIANSSTIHTSENVKLNHASLSLAPGERKQLIMYVNGEYVSRVHWESSNSFEVSIWGGEVSANRFEVVDPNFVPTRQATVTATVVVNNEIYEDSCVVYVEEERTHNTVTVVNQHVGQGCYITDGSGQIYNTSVSSNIQVPVGQPLTVQAVAPETSGYVFTSWVITSTNQVVSTDATYTFTPTSNTTLTANFEEGTQTVNYLLGSTIGAGNCTVTFNGSVSGAGSAAGILQEFPFTVGEQVTLTASAASGYHFVNWTNGNNTVVLGTDATYTFIANADGGAIRANFEQDETQPFSISPSQVSVTVGGTTIIQASNVPAGYTVRWFSSNNSTASIVPNATDPNVATVTGVSAGTAIITAGYGGEVDGGSATCSVTVTGEQPQTRTVGLFTIGNGNIMYNGSVSGAGAVTGSGVQQVSFALNEQVTLTTQASSGSTFVGWTNADGGEVISTSPTFSFTVNDNAPIAVGAKFEESSTQNVSIYSQVVNGSGSGSIYYNNQAVNFQTTFVPVGSQVTFTAVPNSASHFVSWTSTRANPTQDVLSLNASYTFTATQNCQIYANFAQDETQPFRISPSQVSVTVGGTMNVQAINLPAGYTVTWTSSNNSTASIVPNATDPNVATVTGVSAGTATVTASYTENGIIHSASCTVTVSAQTHYAITVTNQSGGSQGCYFAAQIGNGQMQTYTSVQSTIQVPVGQQLKLQAVAPTGSSYVFKNWSNADGNVVSANAIYTFTPTADITLIAEFSPTVTYNLYASGTGYGNGYILYNGQNYGSGYTQISLVAGTQVTLTAQAIEGSDFVNWTDADGTVLGTDIQYTFTANATGGTIRANFARDGIAVRPTVYNGIGGTVMYNNQTLAADGLFTIAAGAQFALTAVAANGYHFVSWSENYDGSSVISQNATHTFTAAGDAAGRMYIYANFEQNQTQPFTLNPSQASVTVGGTMNVQAINLPSGYTVTWTSSNPNVATVAGAIGDAGNPYATITGVSAGTATITASYTENGVTHFAACTVTVTDGNFVVIHAFVQGSGKISYNNMVYDDLMIQASNGSQVTLLAQAASGHTFAGWINADGSMIVENGSFITTPTYTFTATQNRAIGAKFEQAQTQPFSISPSQASVTVGGTMNVQAINLPSGYSITWTSSNRNVASVAGNATDPNVATVTGVSAGTATVTASYTENGIIHSASCTVTVTAPRVKLNHANLSLKPGESEQLIMYVNGNAVSSTGSNPMNWQSSNPSAATVDNNGVVTGVALGGQTTITAMAVVGAFTYTASCEVYVEAQAIVIEETAPVTDGTGTTEVALEIPSQTPFSGSFMVTLPEGVSIDINATQIADGWSGIVVLTITLQSKGVWLFTFTINQQAQQQARAQGIRLRAAVATSKIVDIVYNVAPTVTEDFELVISNLSFTLEDDEGTVIEREETTVPVTVNTPVGIETPTAPITPAKIIGYYNINGQRVNVDTQGITSLSSGIYIIKYDNGTAKKIIIINK